MRKIAAAAIVVLLATNAVAAQAQTWGRPGAGAAAAAASPRKAELAAEFMRHTLTEAALEQIAKSVLPELSTSLGQAPWFKPAWRPLLEEAFMEEFRHDMPKIHRAFGLSMAGDLSEAELEAGVQFVKTPAGRAIMQASVTGARTPKLTRAQEEEMVRVLDSPAGQGFMDKLGKVKFDSVDTDALTSELVPGMFRRFGEKVEAVEGR